MRRLIFIVTAVRDRNIVKPSGNVTVEHAPRRCCPDIGPGEDRYHRAEIAARLIASIKPDASRAPAAAFRSGVLADQRLSRLHRGNTSAGSMPQLVKTDFVEAEIRGRRMLSLAKIRGSSEQNHDDLRSRRYATGHTEKRGRLL